jgi:hypothetical protein
VSAKLLADMSVELWNGCRKAGFKTRVKCSKDSLSRYVIAENAFSIRLSDHPAFHSRESFDYEIVIKPGDNPSARLKQARDLLVRLVGENAVAVA